MINIGIYSNSATQKKEIKNTLIQYFKDLNIVSRIRFIKTKSKILKNLTAKFIEYNIVIICDEDKITYVKRNSLYNVKSRQFIITGWLDIPLSNEKIDEILLDGECNNCPQGIYKLTTKKTYRAIAHDDIECCRWINGKTVFFLKNNDVEETNKSIKRIKSEMPEDYFIDCIQGYIVNLYNIKKIDRVNHTVIMKSGYKIPISKNKYQDTVRQFFWIMFGI